MAKTTPDHDQSTARGEAVAHAQLLIREHSGKGPAIECGLGAHNLAVANLMPLGDEGGRLNRSRGDHVHKYGCVVSLTDDRLHL